MPITTSYVSHQVVTYCSGHLAIDIQMKQSVLHLNIFCLQQLSNGFKTSEKRKPLYNVRPVGRGGSRGFARTPPPFGLEKKFMHRLTVYLSALPFESGSLVSLLLRIATVQASLVAAMRGVCSRRTSAERARKRFIRPCDESTRVNRSLFQALERSPVVLLVMSPHLLFCQPSLVEIQSLLA